MFEKSLQHRHWQIHRTTAECSLGVRRDESRPFPFELSRDPQISGASIKITPLQTKRFSSTKSCRQHEGLQCLVAVSLERLEELSRLLGRERSTFVANHFWWPRERGNVSMNEFPADRLVEALGEHGSNPSNRGRRETTVRLKGEESVDVTYGQFDKFLLAQDGKDMHTHHGLIVAIGARRNLVAHDVVEPSLEEFGNVHAVFL